ncbi:MAG: Hpt domain-containing protein, partial [Planctomycetota bacterium]
MADDLSGFSMLELFRLEAESQTAVLSNGVLAIEELERSPQTVEAMMRAAHSLKGAARIVGL